MLPVLPIFLFFPVLFFAYSVKSSLHTVKLWCFSDSLCSTWKETHCRRERTRADRADDKLLLLCLSASTEIKRNAWITRSDARLRAARTQKKSARVTNTPRFSRTTSIIHALIVNGFQLRLTGVNMIAGCLPSLASFQGSQLCMSSDG